MCIILQEKGKIIPKVIQRSLRPYLSFNRPDDLRLKPWRQDYLSESQEKDPSVELWGDTSTPRA